MRTVIYNMHSTKGLFLALAVLLSFQMSAQFQGTRKQMREEAAGSLQVFPNPSTGKFTVSVKEQERSFHINIYNLIGEMVYHWESGNNTTASIEVDLSKRPDGVYFVELDTEKANVLKRIIIERVN